MTRSKLLLSFLLVGALLFFAGLLVYGRMDRLGPLEWGTAFVVLLVLAFSVPLGLRAIRDEKAGIPAEDEFTARVKEKAAAAAFLISMYIWVLILILFSRSGIETEILLGLGILGMILSFIGSYIRYRQQGPDRT